MHSPACSRTYTILARTILLWLCVFFLCAVLLVGVLHAQTADGPQVLHSATTTNSTGVQQRTRGMSAASVQVVVAGGFDGTIHWETSQDETTYVAVPCRDATTGTASTTATTSGRYLCNIAGAERFQARISGRSVGSATVVAQFSGVVPTGNFGQGMLTETDPLWDVNLEQIGGSAVVTGGVAGSLGVGGVDADGAAVSGRPVQVGGVDGSGNVQRLLTDTSGRLDVNPIASQAGVQGGSGTVSALTQRVVLATDVALPPGANVIGGVNTATASSALADGTNNTLQQPTNGSGPPAYRTFQHLFNGTTWDRPRSGSATSTDPHYGAAKSYNAGGTFTYLSSTTHASTTSLNAKTGLGGYQNLLVTWDITAAERDSADETYDLYVICSDGVSSWDVVHFPQIITTGAKRYTANVNGLVQAQTVTTASPGVAAINTATMKTDTGGADQGTRTLTAGMVRHGVLGDRCGADIVIAGTIVTGITHSITMTVR